MEMKISNALLTKSSQIQMALVLAIKSSREQLNKQHKYLGELPKDKYKNFTILSSSTVTSKLIQIEMWSPAEDVNDSVTVCWRRLQVLDP